MQWGIAGVVVDGVFSRASDYPVGADSPVEDVIAGTIPTRGLGEWLHCLLALDYQADSGTATRRVRSR